MLGKINSLFEGGEEDSKEWTWTLFRALSAAMFMTHGYAKLFGESPQPVMGGGMTSINIAELVSWPLPMEINALFIAGVVEFFGGLLISDRPMDSSRSPSSHLHHAHGLPYSPYCLVSHPQQRRAGCYVFRDLFADLRFRSRPL